MKIEELYNVDQLNEGVVQRAVAAAAVALGMMHSPTAYNPTLPLVLDRGGANVSLLAKDIISIISGKYKVKPATVEQIVASATKHQRSDFPKAEDILAVVGVESSYNPRAVSSLKRDPAVGLMQVRPGVWGLDPASLTDIDSQIKHGSDILHQYYKKLGSKEAALHAYNVGLTNHRKSLSTPSKGNPRYVPKVQKELKVLTRGETRPTPTR